VYEFKYFPEKRQVPLINPKTEGVLKNDDGEIQFEEVEAKFSGFLKLKIPEYAERMKMVKIMNTSFDSDGEIIEGQEFDKLPELSNFGFELIMSTELVRIEDDMKFEKKEMLKFDKDGQDLLLEIGKKLMGGVKLGKN